MANKTAQTYLKRVRQSLICGKADRERLLTSFSELVNSYQQENGETEYPWLVAAFGEPESCAEELLSSLDGASVETARKRQKQFRRFTIAAVSVALVVSVITAAFWYSKYLKQCEFGDEFILVIEPPVEATLEEFLEAKAQEAEFNGGGS